MKIKLTPYCSLRLWTGWDIFELSKLLHILPILLSFFVFFNVYIPNTATAATPNPQNFKLISNITQSLEQHGITWTFDKPVEYGQFVNGDYWVVNPGTGVNITDINPGDTLHTDGIRHMNGSMINPASGQGYDSYPAWYGTDYITGLNVGIGISAETPLVLGSDESLVSTISNLIPGVSHTSYVKTASVLTCLSTAPPVGSFRPGISSSSKTLHNISDIDYSLLKSLAYPNTKPNIAALTSHFQMVWLDHLGGWTGRYLHPTDTLLSNYYYPWDWADAALLLNLDYTIEEKQGLLIGYLQMGIDLYSYIDAGAHGWAPDGGNENGRKWPILFTGIMFNYAPMKNIGAVSGDYLYSNGHGPGNPPADYIHFGEDGQTFYVAQSDVDLTNSAAWGPDTRTAPNYPYTSAMIGMPEWGIRYSTAPQRSDASWLANYRHIGTGAVSWVGSTMAARIMGAKELWNHDVLFDYIDRYAALTKGELDPFGYTVPNQSAKVYWPGGLRIEMYDIYRGLF